MWDEYLSPLDEKLAMAIEQLERMSAAESYDTSFDGWLVEPFIAAVEGEPVQKEVPVVWSPLLVMLNRTIKAQLEVLRSGRAWLSNFVMEEPTYPDGRKMHPDRLFLISPEGRAIEALAEAILEADTATTTSEEEF